MSSIEALATGLARAPAQTLQQLAVLATQGQPAAQYVLAQALLEGRGITADPANPELAVVWYRQAARHGLDWGMYNLANLLATGQGIDRDDAAAYALYRRAAEAGHAKSMNLVGRCLEEGQGVAADPSAAPVWYQRAAHAGDFRGQAAWASVLVERGQTDAALPWLAQALANGSPSFLAVITPQLQASADPRLRALVAATG